MKLIFFDFDGVLVDTLGIAYSIGAEVNEGLSIEEYKSFYEGNIHNAVRSDGTSRKFHPEFNRIYDEKARELTVPSALKEKLKTLASDYILIIISSSHTASIKKILERENLVNIFKETLGSDIERNKVVKIKMILEKYGISPSDAVFVTDTVGDVKEARECGVKSVVVTWGFHDEKTLKKINPEKIVSNPEDLVKAIKEINPGEATKEIKMK